MNESHPCPQCGEHLEVPAAMLGQPVRCGVCSRVFTPRESPSAAEFDARPMRRRERDSYDNSPSPRRGSTRKPLFIVFGVLSLLGLLCCGGLGVFVYKMFNPKWRDYDSTAGAFTTKFPGEPVSGTRLTGRGGETATALTSRRKYLNEEFFIYYVSLSDADLARMKDNEAQDVLDELADGLTAQHPGATPYRQRVTRSHAGHDAMDLALELNDDRHTQVRIVLTHDEKFKQGIAYVVGVTGPGEPDASPWVMEFIDYFQPKPMNDEPEKPAKTRTPFRKK